MIMDKFIIGLFTVFGTIVLGCAYGLLMAWPVMWLWNADLVPAITILRPIGWIQAWGISILVSLLVTRASVSKDWSKD